MASDSKKAVKRPAAGAKRSARVEGSTAPATGRLPFPVVGVGASAGGLEACTALLKELAADTAVAVVVVQHLDPHHKSLLRDLLSKVTEIPVTEVADGIELEPRHVYVNPPDKDVTLRQGVLRLSSRQQDAGKHLPIDRFLTSLAEDQKGGSIGVILSGTGADGTAGLHAIRAEGGIVLAQEPRSAQHPGMPESAILSGCVDFILPPAGIAREITRLTLSPRPARSTAAGNEPDSTSEEPAQLQRIFQMLQSSSNIDFSLYKTDTMRRRIARRMTLHKIHSLAQYAEHLEQNPAEVQALSQDVLIHVTSFFREPEAFRALKDIVFPRLIEGKPRGEPLRIWVPGCSTGEEAYSIAIAVLEFLEQRGENRRFQVFATDISSAAVEKARTAVYSEAAISEVSPERLRRFFAKVGGGYQVSKVVRELCVFARHTLGKDPPFSKLDLVSCRNVLIYLGPALQKRILSVFHYALKPGGFLLLGKAESPSSSAHLFRLEERKCKLYTRNPVETAPLMDLATTSSGLSPRQAPTLARTGAAADLQSAVEGIVWRRRTLAAIVVDADLQVIHFQGNTGPYLEPSTGAASLHLFKLVREGLVLDLRAALHKARKEAVPVRREGIRLEYGDGFKTIDLEVIPMKDRRTKWPDFLILIEEALRKQTARPRRSGEGEVLASLKHELASTREQLQSIIEGQEATNEELETAQEELQSSNEELTTLNDELQNRNTELGLLADDLSNLLVGVDIPIVIVGADRRIRRFTPAAEQLLNLIPTDVGRPISDIKPNIRVADLDALTSEVIDRRHPIERDVQGEDSRWYSLRMRPHKSAENRIEGVLMALMDIDAMKRGLEQVRTSRDEAIAERDVSSALLDMSGAYVLIRDVEGRIVGFNRACEESSGYSFAEVRKRRLWEFLVVPEEADRVKAEFAALLGGREAKGSHESSWLAKDGARRVIAWSSLVHRNADGAIRHVISAGIDITRRTQTEDELRQGREQLRRLTARLIMAQEEERKRLARELHDDLNQRMAMLANELTMLDHDLPEAASSSRPQLQSLREKMEELSDDLRRSAHQLHPSALEHFGLIAALEAYCLDFSKRHSIRLRFTHRSFPDTLSSDISLCLYRVAQECLRNMARHAGAKTASLTLTGVRGAVVLSASDKGVGFDPHLMAGQSGLGLVGVRERVRLCGGTTSVQSAPGKGTKIEVRIPLREVAP